MEMNASTKRFYLGLQVSNDVVNRFYHQLTYQDNFVIKDFFQDSAQLYAAIINAIIESIVQRCPEVNDKEIDRMVNAISEKWAESDAYAEFDGIDYVRNVKKAIQAIQELSFMACEGLTDKQIEGAETYKGQAKTGDIDQLLWNVDTFPYPKKVIQVRPDDNQTRRIYESIGKNDVNFDFYLELPTPKGYDLAILYADEREDSYEGDREPKHKEYEGRAAITKAKALAKAEAEGTSVGGIGFQIGKGSRKKDGFLRFKDGKFFIEIEKTGNFEEVFV